MSYEQEELRRMARRERHAAWTSAKRIPECAGDVASAFARAHPVIAAGGAAALAMSFVAKKRRAAGIEGPASSVPAAIAAFGVRFLPDVLRMVGLRSPKKQIPPEPEIDAHITNGNGNARL